METSFQFFVIVIFFNAYNKLLKKLQKTVFILFYWDCWQWELKCLEQTREVRILGKSLDLLQFCLSVFQMGMLRSKYFILRVQINEMVYSNFISISLWKWKLWQKTILQVQIKWCANGTMVCFGKEMGCVRPIFLKNTYFEALLKTPSQTEA